MAINSINIAEQSNDEKLKSIHALLMSYSRDRRNADALACMLASRQAGEGAMPARLGLSKDEYTRLMQTYYPGVELVMRDDTPELTVDRADEQSELLELLLTNRADSAPDTKWIADIVVTGCMGGNHLWQDLGLWCREDLTSMMEVTFPALAKRNDKNMKWKKFLYKQLCIQEGIYTCRSPSCEVCVDYKECFAPE